MRHYTIPNTNELNALASIAPDYMGRSKQPIMAVYEDAIAPEVCDQILEVGLREEPYNFGTCNAWTRELTGTIIDPVKNYIWMANKNLFNFDIYKHAVGWLQEYNAGDDYHTHIDGHPGQSRKLTGLLMLSEESAYVGGELVFDMPPTIWYAYQKKGTLLVFPPWIHHRVDMIHEGIRHSLNVGVWGPPFR